MKIHPPCTITVADTGAVRHAPGGPTGHFTLCGFVDTSETVSYYDGRPINCKNCLAVVAEVLSWCDPAARSRSMEEWFAVRDAARAALSAEKAAGEKKP